MSLMLASKVPSISKAAKVPKKHWKLILPFKRTKYIIAGDKICPSSVTVALHSAF